MVKQTCADDLDEDVLFCVIIDLVFFQRQLDDLLGR